MQFTLYVLSKGSRGNVMAFTIKARRNAMRRFEKSGLDALAYPFFADLCVLLGQPHRTLTAFARRS